MTSPPRIVRLIRVLEFIGTEEWIQHTLDQSWLQPTSPMQANQWDRYHTTGAYPAAREVSRTIEVLNEPSSERSPE